MTAGTSQRTDLQRRVMAEAWFRAQPNYGAAFAHTTTRGLVAAPLGQVTVLSLTWVTARLRGPQYATIRTSSSLHSPLHVAASQLERMTRGALSLVAAAAPDGPGGPCAPCGPGAPCAPCGPGGPGGPGGPVSPFSPGAPAAPGSPFGPCPQPATQMESAIATTILFTCMRTP